MNKKELIERLKTFPSGTMENVECKDGQVLFSKCSPITVHTVRSNDFIVSMGAKPKVYCELPSNKQQGSEMLSWEPFETENSWGFVKHYIPLDETRARLNITFTFNK